MAPPIWLGSLALGALANLLASTELAPSWFGSAARFAGRVDDDERVDLIVYEGSGWDAGRSWVLSGRDRSVLYRLNASYVVSPLTTLQGMYFYRAPMEFERGRFSGVSMVNVAVRQKLRGDALTATLRVSDPFDTNKMRVHVGDDNVIQFTDRSFSARALHLTIQATFGQAPRVRQPRQEEAPAPQTGFPPP